MGLVRRNSISYQLTNKNWIKLIVWVTSEIKEIDLLPCIFEVDTMI